MFSGSVVVVLPLPSFSVFYCFSFVLLFMVLKVFFLGFGVLLLKVLGKVTQRLLT